METNFVDQGFTVDYRATHEHLTLLAHWRRTVILRALSACFSSIGNMAGVATIIGVTCLLIKLAEQLAKMSQTLLEYAQSPHNFNKRRTRDLISGHDFRSQIFCALRTRYSYYIFPPTPIYKILATPLIPLIFNPLFF